MKAAAALKAVLDFEVYDASLKKTLADRAKLMPGVTPAQLTDMAAEMGGVDKVEAMAAALPGTPKLSDMVAAFGDGKKFGAFVQKTLGGNVGALGTLADKGCKRDPVKLAALATEFEAAPEVLAEVLGTGGLGSHPEALAEIFANGCDGDPAKLTLFCATFDDETKRKNLRTTLDEGGLGQAPAALGALAKGDNGVLLLNVATNADKPKLKTMVTAGGMGGQPPDHPETLKSVLTDALGSDPARLSELYDAFPHADGEMPEMQKFMRAMNGKSEDGSVKAGKRMADMMAAIHGRNGALNNAQLAGKLYDPFFVEMKKRSAEGRAADEGGGRAVSTAGDVITARAPAPGGRIAGSIAGALQDGGAQKLLLDLTTDPVALKDLQDSTAALSQAEATAAALALDDEERDVDPEASKLTQEAIDAADLLVKALAAKPGGGTPAEVAALTKAADLCFDRARDEPGKALRIAATKAGTDAMAAAKQALARQADAKIATMPGGKAQQQALAAMGDIRARIKADPAATDAEKAAMEAAEKASAQALTTTAMAEQMTDGPKQIQKVTDEVAKALSKPTNDPLVLQELDKRKKAAEEAALAADSMTKALKGLAPPVDPKLLTQAADLAEAAVRAGLATADNGAMTAALLAGKTLSDKLAKRAKEFAAAAETSLALAAPEAKPGLLVQAEIGVLEEALARDLTAPGANQVLIAQQQTALRTAAEQANRSALASSDIARLTAIGDIDLAKAAKAEAERQSALDGNSPADAEEAANEKARLAGEAAQNAADALVGLVAPVDPLLIKAAADAADAAVAAAAGASDKVRRDLALVQGQRAAAGVAAALKLNSAQLQTDRTAASKLQVRAKAGLARNQANTFCAPVPPPPGNGALVVDTLNTTLSEIEEAGTSTLASLGAADVGVQNARAEAATKAAKAARPGANGLAKLESQLADTLAQRALAELAAAQAANVVGLIPLVPPTPYPPAPPMAPKNPPVHPNPAAPPFGNPPAPVAPTEASLRDASILAQAAITACTRWVSAAVALKDAATEYLRLADLVPATEQTPAEANDRTAIDTIATTTAPDEWDDAKTALLGVNNTTNDLTTKSKAFMAAIQLSRIGFNGPNVATNAANSMLELADPNLENSAAFATMIGTRAFKTANTPTGPVTTPPSTQDSLMATAANLTKEHPLPTVPDLNAPPPPPPPMIAITGAMAMPGHADSELNLEHMAERHCRGTFTFDPTELKLEELVMLGEFVDTRTGGVPKGGNTDARSTLLTTRENNVRKENTGKTTSMWPEDITPAHIAVAAADALADMKTDQPALPVQSFVDWVYNGDPKHQYSKTIAAINVGPLTLRVTLGVTATNLTGAGGKIRVNMFYPMDQEMLTVFDCHTARKALEI